MTKKILCLITAVTWMFLITGCDTITGTISYSQSTATPDSSINTTTPAPTIGEPEPLDAAFCMDPEPGSHDADYSILRFFPNGVVLQAVVQGQKDRDATWEFISPYLKETATDTFNHGEYQYSDGQIRFALAPAGSDEMAGTVTGRLEDGKMILMQQGTEMIYYLVYRGE